MTMVRLAGAVARQILALIVSWQIVSTAHGQEFRRLLSPDLATIIATYQGSTTNGNTITGHDRYRNISGFSFVITGVADIPSLDPEDLGYPDLTLENDLAARRAMAALYPGYDVYVSNFWLNGVQPRRTWETEITFDRPFPILVNPGDEFEYVYFCRNDLFGPDFGPATGSQMSFAQAEAIGEIIMALNFDWHYVPEPACALLLICGGLLGFPRSRVFQFASVTSASESNGR